MGRPGQWHSGRRRPRGGTGARRGKPLSRAIDRMCLLVLLVGRRNVEPAGSFRGVGSASICPHQAPARALNAPARMTASNSMRQIAHPDKRAPGALHCVPYRATRRQHAIDRTPTVALRGGRRCRPRWPGGLSALTGAAHAALGPNDRFDLVIKGGDCARIPARACAAGATWYEERLVEAIEAIYPAERALRVLDARGRTSARAHRSALACLPVRLGDRHPPMSSVASRAAPPQCRRVMQSEQLRPPSAASSSARRARAVWPSCTSQHRLAASGGRVFTSTMPTRSGGAHDGRERRHRDRRQGRMSQNVIAKNGIAAQARHQGMRALGKPIR